jgi:hypothetical protein
MNDMKPLSVYVLVATNADQKYIMIDADGCLAIFDNDIYAQIAKKRCPGAELLQANFYTEKQVEQLKARVAELVTALQDAADIIQADANTEENYGSLCRMGSALAKKS